MIVLHKFNGMPNRFFEHAMVEALEEEATRITEYFRFENFYVGNGSRYYVHRAFPSFRMFFR